ncbi:LOW QUALITY PROTEIN: hypothetical protein OSB04_021003 [Centaurea solstitialis]|uniref:Uncharacterized protein n=1 Tax=Centaurea solstitialis TaxID=347529 RepID=A0AA38STE2_9ASTR|nr:LOW QUALITY PROTEIN: hypothetical protein OSB04_021003 [Centaurea solstitialis]
MERAQSGLRSQKLKCGRSIQNCFQIDFGDEILRIEREREREIEKERDEERRMEKKVESPNAFSFVQKTFLDQEKKEREIFGFSSSTAQLWENGSFSFVNRRIVVKFGQRLHNSLFFNLTGGIEHRRLQEPHALDELRGQTRVLSWRAIKGNHMPLELVRLRAKARPRLDSETEDSSNRILTIVAMKPGVTALFIGKWSITNALNLLRILRCFYLCSGLKINLSKTSGVGSSDISLLAERLKCKVGSLPFSFLGIPVGSTMNRSAAWQPLIDKFRSRLSNWRASSLSAAGRLTLCKSVLGSLGTYYFSFPFCCFEKTGRIKEKFFFLAEESILRNYLGSLGMSPLLTKIKVVSELSENNSLWASVIKSIHGYHRNSPKDPILSKKGGCWGTIASINNQLHDFGIDVHSLFAVTDDGSLKWSLDQSGV